jgi:hypothetical protein
MFVASDGYPSTKHRWHLCRPAATCHLSNLSPREKQEEKHNLSIDNLSGQNRYKYSTLFSLPHFVSLVWYHQTHEKLPCVLMNYSVPSTMCWEKFNHQKQLIMKMYPPSPFELFFTTWSHNLTTNLCVKVPWKHSSRKYAQIHFTPKALFGLRKHFSVPAFFVKLNCFFFKFLYKFSCFFIEFLCSKGDLNKCCYTACIIVITITCVPEVVVSRGFLIIP